MVTRQQAKLNSAAGHYRFISQRRRDSDEDISRVRDDVDGKQRVRVG